MKLYLKKKIVEVEHATYFKFIQGYKNFKQNNTLRFRVKGKIKIFN